MEFVVADIEDGVELGDMQHVLHFLREIEQFEFASGLAERGETADQFSDPGAVDVVDLGEVKDDFFLALVDQAVNGGAQFVDLIAENDAATKVEDDDVSDLTSLDRQRHSTHAQGQGWREW